jgi:hypothetical protein
MQTVLCFPATLCCCKGGCTITGWNAEYQAGQFQLSKERARGTCEITGCVSEVEIDLPVVVK